MALHRTIIPILRFPSVRRIVHHRRLVDRTKTARALGRLISSIRIVSLAIGVAGRRHWMCPVGGLCGFVGRRSLLRPWKCRDV
jgi:hypothetical protein